MKLATLFSYLVIAILLAGPALADPFAPPEEKPWTYDMNGYDLRDTYPEAEPNDVCPGQTIQCGDIVNPAQILTGTDVDFYEIQLTAGNRVTIGTDASELGDPDVTDSYLELYGPDCSQPRLAFDDDGGPGLYSLILNYTVPATGLYHIKVRGYNATYIGYYKLFVSCIVPPPPPVNDTCEGAVALDRCTTGTIQGDLTDAAHNYSPQPPSPGCTGFSANGKDIVYLLNLLPGDLVHLVYTTPSYDGSIYIVTDCAQPGATCVVGEDDPEPETINWTATTAGAYYLIVDAFTSAGGSAFTLEYAITCPPPSGACCFVDGTCLMLSEVDCAAQGGQWHGPTVSCEPNPCPGPQVGACCYSDLFCYVLTEAECDSLDGPCPFSWMGPGTDCDPNPCPIFTDPPGACCNVETGECRITVSLECAQLPLHWMGPCVPCDPNPCPPAGACCLPDGACRLMTAAECAAAQGTFEGYDVLCDPNPCPPVPTERVSWGRIKNGYR